MLISALSTIRSSVLYARSLARTINASAEKSRSKAKGIRQPHHANRSLNRISLNQMLFELFFPHRIIDNPPPLQQNPHRSHHPSSKAHLGQESGPSTRARRRRSSSRSTSPRWRRGARCGGRGSGSRGLFNVLRIECPARGLLALFRAGVGFVAAGEGLLAGELGYGALVLVELVGLFAVRAGAVPDEGFLGGGVNLYTVDG